MIQKEEQKMRAYKDPTADTAIANVMKEQKKTIGRKAQGRSKGHPQRKVRRCRNRDQGYTEIGGLNGSPFSHTGKGDGYDGNI